MFVTAFSFCHIIHTVFVAYAATLHSYLSALDGPIDLHYERDPAAPSIRRWRHCRDLLSDIPDLTVHTHDTHSLVPFDDYLKKSNNALPASYGAFCKIFAKLDVVAPRLSPQTLPPHPQNIPPPPLLPTLAELPNILPTGGTDTHFPGGENAALSRLSSQVSNNIAWTATFEKPKTSPNTLAPSTTALSPYVTHGCLSARTFYAAVLAAQSAHTGSVSQPPVSLVGQLLWRDYNTLFGHVVGMKFAEMEGNDYCRQIPWGADEVSLALWKEGNTGYPFIDAIMRQLKAEGWIHHLARHAVACFLTRGDLWISWESGAAVFEERLIDADWSINAFNWQWLSCSAHFYQYFRCYSPVAFGKKTDPNGDYIRKWCPELKNVSKKHIYEPWNMSKEEQKAAKCVIGKDYVERIERIKDHTKVSKSNMEKMSVAYKIHNVAGVKRKKEQAAGGGGKKQK